MNEASLTRLLKQLPADAVVLDIGGWAKPLTRANWVLDKMPYETRGLYGRDGDLPERFSERTWLVRDICAHEPYPFADKSIDFVVCSHTLEDVRDPVWVCAEMNRVARAGYIEVPSRLEEQSYGFQGPWTGWGHHHWLVDVTPGAIHFTFKHHILHGRDSDHFPPGFHDRLQPEEKIQTLWWEGGFEYGEQMFSTAEEIDGYLAGFVAENLRRRRFRPGSWRRALRRRLAEAR